MSRRARGDPGALVRLVARTLREQSLLPSAGPLVVAVSGGADSVFLLRALIALPLSKRPPLHVAHFNHGWRGAASDADASFVRQLAGALDLPFHLGASTSQPGGGSPEERARHDRYAFLRDVCRQTGATAVATGHTLDDQVETVLLALLRGSGPAGLAGMPARGPLPAPDADGLWLVRPLLEVARDEIRAGLGALGQEWREDATNADLSYPRNRLRLEVLPTLEAISPGFRAAVLRSAALSRQAAAFVHDEAARAARSLFTAVDHGLHADRSAFLSLHPALQAETLRWAVTHVRGNTADLEWAHVQGALRTIERGRGGAVAWLTRRMRIRLERGQVVIEPDNPPAR